MNTNFATQFEGLQSLGSFTYLDENLNTVSVFTLAWKRFVCWILCTSFEDTTEIEKYRSNRVAAAIDLFVLENQEQLFGRVGSNISARQLEKLVTVVGNLEKFQERLEKKANGSQENIESIVRALRTLRVQVNLRNPGTF